MPNEGDQLLNAMLSGDMFSMKLQKVLNQMFVDDAKQKAQNDPREGLHASSILAPFTGVTRLCFREHVLNKFYLPIHDLLAPDTLRTFLVGWYLHLMWQRLFKQSGYAVEVEKTRIDEKWGVYHTPDVIARFPHLSGNHLYIIEIKTMNARSFEKAVELSDPRRSHEGAFKQAQLYMYLTNVPEAVILLHNKNTSEFVTFTIQLDKVFIQPYIDRLDILVQLYERYAQERRLPKRVCEHSDTPRAKRCPMRDVCWVANDAERQTCLRGTLVNPTQRNVSLTHEEE